MIKYIFAKSHALLLTLAVGSIASSTAFGSATIVIQQGPGFNDPTPVAPVGGNNGTTLGQQRLNAFQFAAGIWAATINSNVPITVQSSWEPRPCTATGGTGGTAVAGSPFRNFPGAPLQNTWFVQALANSFAGTDLDPGTADMALILNVNVGNPDCFADMSWYLGFDGKNPANSFDTVAALLHEFGHGLGFRTFTDRTSGAQVAGFPSMFDTFLFDKVIGKTWPQMTNSERAISATNTGNLVWTGPQVTADVPNVLGTPRLRINTPHAIAGDYLGAAAVFGALLESPGVTGNVIQALDPSDGDGLATTDGCSALTNAGAVAGKVAIIDRGTCNFTVKVKNAQNAGAIAVIIANNRVSTGPDDPDPPDMGGLDPTILIPALSVTQASGDAIKAQPGGAVNATLFLDRTTPSGADSSNRVLMHAPPTLVPGSSVAHFDFSMLPNQVMEPSQSGDTPISVLPPHDLTFSLLRDLGWTGVPPAPPSVQLASSNFSIGEAGTTLNVGVSRTGDTSGASTVDYTTSDTAGANDCNLLTNAASSRCDYLTTLGKLTFAAGETSKTVSIPIIDDGYAEGGETFTITLSNVTGATLGTATATLTITDNESVNGTNPIDTTSFFVRQHYIDFLNRDPDPPGLTFWTGEITECSNLEKRQPGESFIACTERKRANTAAAFFLSPEFQNTASFVLRVYWGTLGKLPNSHCPGVPSGLTGHCRPLYPEYVAEVSQVATGIVVSDQLDPNVINANKRAFIEQFVTKPAFRTIYDSLNSQQFVDKLFETTGINASAADRATLVNGLNGINGQPATETRSGVVFKVVDGTTTQAGGALVFNTTYGQAFYDQEFADAFVFMEYIGYLRRNPDQGGYEHWLGKLKLYGNWMDAQMVLAFISSPEYRARFGQP